MQTPTVTSSNKQTPLKAPPSPFVIPRACHVFNCACRLWPESLEEHLPIGIAGVLRLRAISGLWRDRFARRFAQDDGFVGGLKNIRLAVKKHEKIEKSQAPNAA
jgi:hypothetical protein